MSATLFEKSSRDLLLQIMQCRRDVRGNYFSDEPVSDDIIEKLLDAAMTAPSVGLSEPWEFILIRDLNTRQKIVDNYNRANQCASRDFKGKQQTHYKKLKLEGITESAFNLAVFYNPPQEPVLGQNSMKDVGRYSVVCAIQNLWLMARAYNIGLGWVSILDPEKVKMVLGVPDDHELIGYLCLGYVHEFLEKPELEQLKWKKRRKKSASVHFEKYSSGDKDSLDMVS